MRTIDNDIKRQEFKKVYLLYGEERYLIRQYRDKLKKAISEPLAKADMPNNIAASTAATITPAEGCISITSPKASVMVDISNF